MRRPPFCTETQVMTTTNQNLDVGSCESRMERMKKILSSPLTRKKSTSSPSGAGTKVFGSSLEVLARSSTDGGTGKVAVPFVVTRICQYIEKNGMSQEGIFRLSGNARLIERLKSSFNTSGDAPLESEGDVASAAALLKLFLRELAEPVVPIAAQDGFLHAARSNSQNIEQFVLELKELVNQLPEEHFLLLQYLVRFLLRVSLLEEQNRMSASSLGIVFGPNLFRVSDDFSGLKDQAVTNQIVTTLIKNYAAVFEQNSNYATQQILKQPLRSVTEPLSVLIPPVDDSVLTLRGRQGQEIELPTKQIPVLMVDSFVDIVNHTSHYDHIHDEQSNHRVSTPPCRKRKERKFSGEEQVFRSSSEERPAVDRQQGETYLSVAPQIRRCNSHEEMRNQTDSNANRGRRKSSAEMVGVNLLMSSGGQVILSTEEKELSPHPPKPKRRELEAPPPPPAPSDPVPSSLSEPYHYRAIPQDQYDFHEMQRSAERMAPRAPSRSRRPPSRGLRKSYSEGMEDESALLYGHNTGLERRSWTPTSPHPEYMDSVHKEISSQGSSPRPHMSRHSSLDRDEITLPRTVLDHLGLETFHRMHRSLEDTDSLDARDCIPHLDLNTLHEHGDGDEPILSEQRYSWSMAKPTQEDVAMLSPSAHHLKKTTSFEAPQSPSAYKSYFHHRSGLHLDPSLPPSPPVEQADLMKSTMKEDEAMAMTVKQLNKKMRSLKKRVKNFEELFEKEHGFRPSIAEKMNYPEIKKILLEMNKTRKDLRELKEDSQTSDLSSPTQELALKKQDVPSVEDSLQDALRNLSAKRRMAQRPEVVEDMTQDQIQEEKLAIQKVLLRFESIHGRPTSKGDRDMMRPLYDRYRNVKRLITRSSSLGALGKGKDPASELQPILEHETMDFTSPQHHLRRAPLSDDDHLKEETVEPEAEEPGLVSVESSLSEVTMDTPGERLQRDRQLATSQAALQKETASIEMGSKSSNLHELPLSELLDEQQQSRLEKRRVRRMLREFEEAFQRQTGRRVQKEDRTPMETVYSDYKHIKARLKLLEALISKHEQM